MKKTGQFNIRLLIINVGIICAAALAVPVTSRADIFKPSAKDQIKLGDQAAAQVLQKYKEVTDDRAVKFRHLGERLVKVLSSRDRGPWNYRFHVIESKEVNAFALPGGQMFMFTGLLSRTHSDSELAAVTGHEMTHVRKEHWAHAYAASQERSLGLGLLLGLAHANNSLRMVAGLTESVINLKYSRSEEDQADEGGLKNMVAAGYDPQGMLDLFHTLQTSSSGSGGTPEFLSDHPLTSERIKKTQQRINAMNRSQNSSQTDNQSSNNQSDRNP